MHAVCDRKVHQNEGEDLLTGKLFDDSFPLCKCCQDSCDVRVFLNVLQLAGNLPVRTHTLGSFQLLHNAGDMM